jgi:iron complex transport system substrate-binding protein
MFPKRIICLTEETTETLYLLGEGERVVGVSGYTVRPPEARQKPRVSSFLHAKYDRIEALEPDLILAFSDLQANITTELVKRGFAVFTFNQRSVEEILQMIRVLGGIVGATDQADALVAQLALGLDGIREAASSWPIRPRVYFEEWDDPLISGIRWVDELVEVAGGQSIFPELREARLAKDRIVSSDQVIAAAPDVIIGSWCGKPLRSAKITARPGWDRIPAVRNGHIYEVKSAYILQPGPAALTEGVKQIHRILGTVATGDGRRAETKPSESSAAGPAGHPVTEIPSPAIDEGP